MKTIELALQSITGYLVSISRNTVDGWYELEIGLPTKWEFGDNDEIKCEIITENETGKLIKISPKKEDVVIDDLISFVEVIVHTNKQIAEKEKQFTDKMQEMKGILEKEANRFYQELDELKANSFKSLNDEFVKNLRPETPKKPRKPRTTNPKADVKETATSEIITLESKE